MLKRPPAPLNLTCGVCSAPAPDHLHFGGKVRFLWSLFTTLLLKPTPAIPAEHSSGEQFSARKQRV